MAHMLKFSVRNRDKDKDKDNASVASQSHASSKGVIEPVEAEPLAAKDSGLSQTDRSQKDVFRATRLSRDGGSEADALAPVGSTSGPPQPMTFAGFMIKGNRSDLARFFGLGDAETLREDYHCALRKRVLLQGRMYIFDHHVCFYSAVFGFVKKRTIEARKIVSLRKKKHLGFPNSIEIETDDGRKEFYTSFLSRDDAYRIIHSIMMESKRSGTSNSGNMPSDFADLDMANSAQGDNPAGPRRAVTVDSFANLTGGVNSGAVGSVATMPRGPGTSHSAAAMMGVHRASTSLADDVVEDGEEDEEDNVGVWVVESRLAPPVTSGARPLVHAVLPCTAKDFFDVVLMDNAPFLEDFLESQGNRRINLSSWKRHEQLGHVRDLQFTSPIKGAFGNWGVSHTACYQSHRFCLYAGEQIVFESSQTMTDIPYGDCFTVDLRWDIKAEQPVDPDDPKINFDIYIRVPFSRKCLFKSVIESGSFKQVKETYTAFVEELRAVLQERHASKSAVTFNAPLGVIEEGSSMMRERMTSMGTMGRTGTMGRGGTQLMTMGSSRVTPTLSSGNMRRAPSVSGALQPQGSHLEEQHGGQQGGEGGGSGLRASLIAIPGQAWCAAGTAYENGINMLLNIMQCPITPPMRSLVCLLVFMFIINILMFMVTMWAPGGGAAPHAAGHLPGEGGSGLGLGMLAPEAGYWHARLGVLQQELQLLQGRMEAVAREVAMVVQHLPSPESTVLGGGADAGVAAAAAASCSGQTCVDTGP